MPLYPLYILETTLYYLLYYILHVAVYILKKNTLSMLCLIQCGITFSFCVFVYKHISTNQTKYDENALIR